MVAATVGKSKGNGRVLLVAEVLVAMDVRDGVLFCWLGGGPESGCNGPVLLVAGVVAPVDGPARVVFRWFACGPGVARNQVTLIGCCRLQTWCQQRMAPLALCLMVGPEGFDQTLMVADVVS